jgi:hypothetical protein
VSALFQSPGSQAQSAATATAGLQNQEIQQLEGYTSGQEQQQRGAIAGLGANPYFGAAGNMSPAGYAVDPSKTASFSAPPPPQQGNSNYFALPPAPANYFAAPPAPRRPQPVARNPQAA